LITRGIATRREIREFWDINDVVRQNEILTIQDDLEWWAGEEMRRSAKTGK
jgi:hypothetical protein